MKEEGQSRGFHRNLISFAGLALIFIGAALTVISLVVHWSFGPQSPYADLVTMVAFPGVIVFGGMVFALGMWVESRRRKRHGDAQSHYPRIDLNNPRQRRLLIVSLVLGFCLLMILGSAGYNAVMFTESNRFCGKVCHGVMQPENDSYEHSAHARVLCVDCHVGAGVDHYVKAKISGVSELIMYLRGTYSRPIQTPIKDLRPARETCEECHWPSKFFGAQLMQVPYYRYDETNTSDQISFVMKTGGGSARLGQSAGIHWHMIQENRVFFAARDAQLQDIPWFKVTGPHGEERVYTSKDKPISQDELAALPMHEMDCIDCHNRPAHVFPAPDRAMDIALRDGLIPGDLPWIKKVTSEALMAPYPDNETASAEIRNRIFGFYSKNYPIIYRDKPFEIQRAVTTAVAFYNRSVFPKMNVKWDTYPDNIGHRNWPGCFRCHDNKHATSTGQVLTNECTACHSMPQRGPIDRFGDISKTADEEWHPFPLSGKHGELMCHSCHRVGLRPSADCNACHKLPTNVPMGDMKCKECHTKAPARLPLVACGDCHEGMAGLHTSKEHQAKGCVSCHKPHQWSVSPARKTCLTCHEERDKRKACKDDGSAECTTCHAFVSKK